MFSRWKMRQVFRIGGATYEHATRVTERKNVWMVMYLRSRRDYSDLSRMALKQSALSQKRWSRQKYFETKGV